MGPIYCIGDYLDVRMLEHQYPLLACTEGPYSEIFHEHLFLRSYLRDKLRTKTFHGYRHNKYSANNFKVLKIMIFIRASTKLFINFDIRKQTKTNLMITGNGASKFYIVKKNII